MKLRHPKSTLTQFKDTSTPLRTWRSKLTQWIYLAIIAFIVLYAVYYLSFMHFYFNQRGLVQVDHVVVASSRGGRILAIPVKPGEHVKKGDLLMRVAAPADCHGQTMGGKGLADLKMKNALDRVRKKQLVQKIKLKNYELKQLSYRRSMELYANHNVNLQGLSDEILALKAGVELLNQQIYLRSKAMKKISAIVYSARGCQDEMVRAPANGTVITIKHKVFEVLERTGSVMDFIKDKAAVHITANFRNDYYDSLSLGEKVDIRFPDGSKSQGVISEIKSTAIPFPEQENTHYLPYRTRIMVTIEPLEIDSSEADQLDHWRFFNEMEVEVRGWR